MRMGRNPASAEWRPTIIAELTRNPGTCTYGEQVTLMKELSADLGLANVILVLGDADAAFAMPKDDDRQTPIWVDDFTEDEAHAYLDKLEYLLPPPPPSSPSPPPSSSSPPPPSPSPPPPSPSDCSGGMQRHWQSGINLAQSGCARVRMPPARSSIGSTALP